MRRAIVILAGAVSLALLSACGGANGDASSSPPPTSATVAPSAMPATVAIQTFMFNPTPLQVRVGTTVTWKNSDEILHTVTSGTPDAKTADFSGMLNGKGTEFSFRFDTPGTYVYFCERHQGMRGEVRVNQ